MNTARSKKSIPMRPDRNILRQQATAINLAKGMSIEKAMLQAGYSPSYAHDQGYKAVKRPCIQSVFTESCERIMAERDMQIDKFIVPYFDALTANMIVKIPQLGNAQEVDLPDHSMRMSAADRLIALYGGKLTDKN